MIAPQLYERFISLLESNIGIILKISKAYTNTAQDREDLMNDMAYEMWKAFPNFKGKSKVSTWVYRVALNTAINFYRKARKNREFIQSAIEIYHAERSNESEEDPQIEILYECISELDEFSKAIVLLYMDGYKHEEIAEITGISRTNVGTRISRIKEELRSMATLKQEHYGIG